MTFDPVPAKERVVVEPAALSVGIGSRIAFLFDQDSDRTRFAPFIAAGISKGEKCVIATDPAGKQEFGRALADMGVEADSAEASGLLLFITEQVGAEDVEGVAHKVQEIVGRSNRPIRFISDLSWMASSGCNERDFLRLEVKGHLFAENKPCTFICQYDVRKIQKEKLTQIIAAHQFTIKGNRVRKNPDRRPLTQIIFEGMDEQLRALTKLQDASLVLTSTLNLNEMLDAVMDAALGICRTDRVSINYVDESGEARIVRSRGLSDEYLKNRRVTRKDNPLFAVIAEKRPLIIEDIDEIGPSYSNYPIWQKEGIRSIVTLPLVSEGKVFGFIGTACGVVRRYSPTEVDAMAILAAHAGAAITNAGLFEQLRAADRAKDEFLATLSHELRTPLTPILGWIKILSRFAQTDDLLAQGFEVIERNARQQAELINDLLDLTRIITGKTELFKEPSNLSVLIKSTIDLVKPQAESRHIDLEFSTPDFDLVCNVDPMRIQQILTNLLTNAIKFTPEGGRVDISLAHIKPIEGVGTYATGEVLIEVADTGIGIEPQVLPRVFDRFFQAHGGINRKYSGLGLGLAITRALVEMHGGNVSVFSPGQNAGSIFSVHLPGSVVQDIAAPGLETNCQPPPGSYHIRLSNSDIAQDRPSAVDSPAARLRAAARKRAETSPTESLRLLLVEDSSDTLEILSRWLTSCGFEVMSATRAIEGLQLAATLRPDLVISDIGMPEMDGYQLVRRLRKLPGLADVPAVALTGYAREKDRQEALEAGYNAHLAKPADMEQLLELVDQLINRRAPKTAQVE